MNYKEKQELEIKLYAENGISLIHNIYNILGDFDDDKSIYQLGIKLLEQNHYQENLNRYILTIERKSYLGGGVNYDIKNLTRD